MNNDSLGTGFSSQLDLLSQCVSEATLCLNHTLDLVLAYGIEIEHIIVFPQNPLLLDHHSINFKFLLLNYMPQTFLF